jgi:hypothetical protein
MTPLRALLLAAAVACGWGYAGYTAYGYCLGNATQRHPSIRHHEFCRTFAVGGLLALVAMSGDGFRHWRTTPLSKEERWAAFQRQWPTLGRDYFERNE